MIIDTGSADLWLATAPVGLLPSRCSRADPSRLTQCSGCTAETPLFDPNASSTAGRSGKSFEIIYGSGDASGTLVRDVVGIAGLRHEGQVSRRSLRCALKLNISLVDLRCCYRIHQHSLEQRLWHPWRGMEASRQLGRYSPPSIARGERSTRSECFRHGPGSASALFPPFETLSNELIARRVEKMDA